MKEKSHRSNWLHVRLTDSEAEKLEEELHRLEENNQKISASTYARQQLFSSSPERIRMMCNDIRAIRSEIHYSLRRLQESEDPNQKEIIEVLKSCDDRLAKIREEVGDCGCNGSEKSEGK